MTLGELKVACIKGIKLDDNQGFSSDNIEDYKTDRDYKKYFNNITNSLNNGIRRLIVDDRIPFQIIELPITSRINELSKADLAAYNIYSIKGIFMRDVDGSIFDIETIQSPNKILFTRYYEEGTLLIYYEPNIAPFTEETPDDTDLDALGLNNLVCGYLTYFVKCELWERVEPTEAQNWRAYAEQYKAALSQNVVYPTQRKVVSVIKL